MCCFEKIYSDWGGRDIVNVEVGILRASWYPSVYTKVFCECQLTVHSLLPNKTDWPRVVYDQALLLCSLLPQVSFSSWLSLCSSSGTSLSTHTSHVASLTTSLSIRQSGKPKSRHSNDYFIFICVYVVSFTTHLCGSPAQPPPPLSLVQF